jgi:hypothetical protein
MTIITLILVILLPSIVIFSWFNNFFTKEFDIFDNKDLLEFFIEDEDENCVYNIFLISALSILGSIIIALGWFIFIPIIIIIYLLNERIKHKRNL